MKKKILSFVYDGKMFLALRRSSHPKHSGDFWFVVTGGVKKDEEFSDAAKREIKEETNLEVSEIIDLNWGSIYHGRKKDCEEHNFIAFVKSGNIKLNEEHTEFKWLEIDKFINLIKWDDDKKFLRKVLEKAIKKQVYFKDMNLKDYR